MAEFQDRLNQALQMRDMTPAELSRITGVNEGAISQYRKGAYKASQRNLEKLAQALQVSIAWLMGADVPMNDTSDEDSPVPELENVYFRFAKEAQDSGIDPEDIRMALDTIKRIREK